MSSDLEEMIEQDIDRYRNRERSGGFSPAAMIELVLLSMTALVGLLWIIALYWTPDPIPGDAWLGVGFLGIALFGLPAVVVFVARRGGVDIVRMLVREVFK